MGLEYVISSGLSGLSTWEDYERLKVFFEVSLLSYSIHFCIRREEHSCLRVY